MRSSGPEGRVFESPHSDQKRLETKGFQSFFIVLIVNLCYNQLNKILRGESDLNLLVIDGQGGQLGSQIIKAIRTRYSDINIIAVGTNATATTSMIKSGANQGATGENPVVVASRKADIIIGPVGIVIADSLLGEITPKMAVAIGQSDATKILIPVNKCDNLVAGVPNLTTTALIDDTLNKLQEIINKKCL